MLNIQKPMVLLLNESGLGVSEIAARTCYDSFDKSENDSIQNFKKIIDGEYDEQIDINDIKHMVLRNTILDTKKIDDSELLKSLAWVHHHHSILEHTNLTFYIQGTSRAVLQEYARHRLQAISVKSTRYTMSNILYAFIASFRADMPKEWFTDKIVSFNMFVQEDMDYHKLIATQIFDKLMFQYKNLLGPELFKLCLSNENLEFWNLSNEINKPEDIFRTFLTGKTKRNVGDNFKDIVDDNWKTDLVSTFNLRSLKNFLQLRNSGAAYFQIEILAKEMQRVIPEKYLNLIVKNK